MRSVEAVPEGEVFAVARQVGPSTYDAVVATRDGRVLVRLDGYHSIPVPMPIPDDVAGAAHGHLRRLTHGGTGGAINRLAVLESGEPAVRVVAAVGNLNRSDAARSPPSSCTQNRAGPGTPARPTKSSPSTAMTSRALDR